MQRDRRLQGLSSDHHHALVLARRVHRQLAEDPAASGLLEVVQAEFDAQLQPHFEIEEELLIPGLASAGRPDLARRTLEEHEALRQHLERARHADRAEELGRFARLLEAHVRFEERVLFPECESRLGDDVLEDLHARRPAPGGSA